MLNKLICKLFGHKPGEAITPWHTRIIVCKRCEKLFIIENINE